MNDADLKVLIERTAAETTRHFDVVSERTDRKISVVAEGVASLGEGLRGEIQALKDETRHGFTETQAMICERMQELAEARRETREFPRVQRRPVRPSFESIVTCRVREVLRNRREPAPEKPPSRAEDGRMARS